MLKINQIMNSIKCHCDRKFQTENFKSWLCTVDFLRISMQWWIQGLPHGEGIKHQLWERESDILANFSRKTA